MTECPDDRTVIPPGAGNSCPECPSEPPPSPDTVSARIPIRSGCTMPEVCFKCGQHTRRKARVVISRPSTRTKHRSESLEFLSGFLWLAFGFLSIIITLIVDLLRALARLILRTGKPQRHRISLHIRQCRSCSRKRAPYPHQTSYERREMEFQVHPVFAGQFEQLNLDFDTDTGRWRT